ISASTSAPSGLASRPASQQPPDAGAQLIGAGVTGSRDAAGDARTEPSEGATTSQSPDTARPPSAGGASRVRHRRAAAGGAGGAGTGGAGAPREAAGDRGGGLEAGRGGAAVGGRAALAGCAGEPPQLEPGGGVERDQVAVQRRHDEHVVGDRRRADRGVAPV